MALLTGADCERLSGLTPNDQQQELRAYFEELLQADPATQRENLTDFVKGEFSLPRDRLVPLTKSRLRVLLELEPDAARTIAKSYDDILDSLSGTLAMRRFEVVQTVASDMHDDDLERLKGLIPSIVKQISQVRTPSSTAGPPPLARTPKRGRWWWPFGRRGR